MTHPKTPIAGIAATLALWLAATAATADEAALYDQPAPEDAVFVRMLGGPVPMQGQIEALGTTLPAAALASDTYVAISAADLPGTEPGAYFSLAAHAGGTTVIREPARETAAKVHLILLNAGAEAVRLVLPGRGAEVIAPVAPGAAASRPVNPVSATVAVERVQDGAPLGTFDLSLSRGQNLTFVVEGDAARVLPNAFGPVLGLN